MLSVDKFVKAKNPDNANLKVLAFDPGETVGWAFFDKLELVEYGQLKTFEFEKEQIQAIEDLMLMYKPDVIIYEAYRIYSWKTEDHTWSEVHTAQIIGVIRWFVAKHGLPCVSQTAQIAKQFCTDEKLKAWNLWIKGAKHTRDAVRHAVYYLIFGSRPQL